MDSTTISLFSNVLKGAGRNPKIGKKNGGIKSHAIMKAQMGVPEFTRRRITYVTKMKKNLTFNNFRRCYEKTSLMLEYGETTLSSSGNG